MLIDKWLDKLLFPDGDPLYATPPDETITVLSAREAAAADDDGWYDNGYTNWAAGLLL